MTLVFLIILLIASFAGLAAGRWKALLLALPLVAACALLLGTEGGALAALAAGALAAGVYMHRAVAEYSGNEPRAL